MKLKNSATQELVDAINNSASDPVAAEIIRENILGYTGVLQEGKFKIKDYINAVKYVSYKLMGNTNIVSYTKTFPQRYQDLVQRGTTPEDIASYVGAYNKNKLVNLILEQSLIPTWVLNNDLYQKAINQQAHLMMHGKSDYVKTQAANSLLTHLSKPKDAVPLVQIDINESSGMNELKDMLGRLAEQQIKLIEKGVSTKSIAEQSLIVDVDAKETL